MEQSCDISLPPNMSGTNDEQRFPDETPILLIAKDDVATTNFSKDDMKQIFGGLIPKPLDPHPYLLYQFIKKVVVLDNDKKYLAIPFPADFVVHNNFESISHVITHYREVMNNSSFFN